jgi:hypothetical protein
MLIGFLPTFAIARYIVRHDPNLALQVGGSHVHHFVYGLALIAIIGYLALAYPKRWQRPLSFVYGIGLALVADEAGIWVRLNSYYYGKLSYDAVFAVAVFLIGVVYFSDFVRAVGRRLFPRRSKP